MAFAASSLNVLVRGSASLHGLVPSFLGSPNDWSNARDSIFRPAPDVADDSGYFASTVDGFECIASSFYQGLRGVIGGRRGLVGLTSPGFVAAAPTVGAGSVGWGGTVVFPGSAG